MLEPYKVLNIAREASDDEVKKAYRSLSRRYHPDANVNNPNKAQAEEKFKEIQQAYQQIMKERQQGYSSAAGGRQGYGDFSGFGGFGAGGFGSGYGNYYGRNSSQSSREGWSQYSDEDILHFNAAGNYINARRYREALNVLATIQDRKALWYYYSALSHAGLGNNIQALEHAQMASQLEPDNIRYQTLASQLQAGGNWYRSRRSPYADAGFGGGNLCMKLCIANFLCNLCCGGSGMCFGGGM